MKYIAVSAVMVAILLAATSCTNIVTIHEYHSGKSDPHADTVYVLVDPSETPGEQGGWTSPETQPGSGETGEYTEPWTTYYSLYGGAGVETCTYQSGRTSHTLLGNIVTGSGAGLQVDSRVWRNDNIIEELVLILEFEPPAGESHLVARAGNDESRSESGSVSLSTETGASGEPGSTFLQIRSGDQLFEYSLEDCSSVEVDGENEQMKVKAILPVSLALIRDIAYSNSVSLNVSYPGTGKFTKYFTEMNDGNMYQFYTLFVIGDGNPTILPVER